MTPLTSVSTSASNASELARIGVLGGMFDPVHNGHISMAERAFNLLQLQQLHLTPCHLPNHREPALSSPQQRLQMLRLAVGDRPGWYVNDMELRRSTTSYAVDTMQQMRADNVGATLVFVLGIDSFNTLDTWHRWQDLLKLCHFLVLSRPGVELAAQLSSTLELEQRQVFSAEQLFIKQSGHIMLVNDLAVDISSTQVRSAVSQCNGLDGLVNSQVLEYMNEQGLYQLS
ncbi:MAG: nicotinic acid mononucleotide adenylyltransferase [SAR86 cluster bacterium]|uniref:Probable nicotinate-nucleotide adenylyltransferase n=1 Tax=SAR86 cluster bacterium TaxID=2030880 RepID=A0A2A4MHZ5_9GAMM|nr:MAG: nicotinic acid mononucleotide adenylyltransferase [SAR86 cluster bacterium]